uniref:Uridine kinase n=1 Tax=Parastrongyloides trichosuri TaxID=131310 RepID=A0A0N4ZLU3_PARTI
MVAEKNDNKSRSFLIGVAGGTASGKSSVCQAIVNKLGKSKRQVLTICQDSFYRELTPEESEKARRGDFNFDHPTAFDTDELVRVLENLKNGIADRIPVYDYKNHCRYADQFQYVEPTDIIIVEGILIFYDERLCNMFNTKLFVDTDSDIRLARRVRRDTQERGRDLKQILNQYLNFVKPSFDEFVFPTKKHADVIIPRGADNHVAIDLIVQHMNEILRSPRSSPRSSIDVDESSDDEMIESRFSANEGVEIIHVSACKITSTPH